MILGLRTAIVPTPDLAAGKAWYSQAFETQPYFDEPFYVGFNIGGFELGLIPDGNQPGMAGAQPYWGVADIAAELTRLMALGASALQPATDVGGGILVGAVLDPFGNALHLVQNPHFDTQAVR
jgi:predicted enzyme related to lactoylglutathione lyase